MNRRELIKMIAAATGTAFVGGAALLSGCSRNEAPGADAAPLSHGNKNLSDADIALLDEVAETIIPRTDTPGAKDAEVGQFMRVFVKDCYTPGEQQIFYQGIEQLQAASQSSYNRDFMSLSQEQRHCLIEQLDHEAIIYNAQHRDRHYFTMLKQLTLFGFFTSRVGATEVLRYLAIPGRFDSCLPYQKGDRAWATN